MKKLDREKKSNPLFKKISKQYQYIIICLLGIATPFAFSKLIKMRSLSEAENYLKKGYAALAEDEIEPYRHQLTSNEKNCKLLLTTYYSAQKSDKLSWASQACLESKIEIPEAYLGLAVAQELAGKDATALQLLTQYSPKFATIPDFDLRMAAIYKRNRNPEEASKAYLSAIQKSPANQQVAFEAFQYFSSIENWTQAKILASQLKNSPTENPEVKFILARALHKTGDKNATLTLLEQAKGLLTRAPELRPTLEKNYPDLFLLMTHEKAPNERFPASP